ncbi:MAG: hypothetical protein NFCOHLIN_01123 [Gammaproteobacteria bacterium]|nr:hypothetical protein [Gammaproteobacteria bacterium]
MNLSLAPIPWFWDRARVFAFYGSMAATPIDVVYLGETVCSKRRELRLEDWLEIAAALAEAGKEVVLSTLTLIEAESELSMLKRIVDNGRFLVEANDMAAVDLLSARELPFVIGPHVNVYNGETLALLARLGARRWVVPTEISRAQLAALPDRRFLQMQTEVQICGDLALAFSARCYTARAHNLQKDACAFVCREYPDGLPLATMEDQPFLVLNGIQTRSAAVCNLLADWDDLGALQVDVGRIVPQSAGTGEVIALVHEVATGRRAPAAAAREVEALSGTRRCNGHWHGAAGMAQVE